MRTKWFVLSGAVIALDQLTKIIASAWLTLHVPVAVMPHLNLTLVHNPGAAFSLFGDAGGWQRWMLLGVTAVVCLFLYYWLKRLDRGETATIIAIAAIIGGALGNAVDRLLYGHVVDFIDLYYGEYHWPVFNLADAAITLGALALIVIAARGD